MHPSHCLVGRVLLCNVTKYLKEAVAEPTWVQSTLATRHGKYLKEAVAEPTWVQSTLATRHGKYLKEAVAETTYMGAVNTSNKTWQVLEGDCS